MPYLHAILKGLYHGAADRSRVCIKLFFLLLLAEDDDGPEVKRSRTDSPAAVAGYSGAPPGAMMPGAMAGMQRPPYGAPG